MIKGSLSPRSFAGTRKRLLMLEDLGDETLEDALAHRAQASIYGEAIDLLAQLHERTRDATAADLPGLAKTFDAEFLRWELDHFREYLIEARQRRAER